MAQALLRLRPAVWLHCVDLRHVPGADVAYLLLYVDDIILTASSTKLLSHIIELLHSEFAMTDLGDLHHFLGISCHAFL
jgi:hypothetical protein